MEVIKSEKKSQIELTIIRINGKQLKRSVFNQLISEAAFDKDMQFIGQEKLGYVNNNGTKYLVFINKTGQLRRNLLQDKWFYPDEANIDYADIGYPAKKKAIQNEFAENQIFL